MKKSTILSIIMITLLFLTSCMDTTNTNNSPIASVSVSPINLPEGDIAFEDAGIYSQTGLAGVSNEKATFITSVQELNDYYTANSKTLESMKDGIFQNNKYDEDFFKTKCLLLYFKWTQAPNTIIYGELDTVKYENNIIKIKYITAYVLDSVASPLHIVIELDNKYADKEVEITWISENSDN